MINTVNILRLIAVIVFIVCAPFIGGILDGFDRKISARMQRRIGPKVTQPFYDVLKLFNKEFVSVNKSQLFLLLSYLFFVIFAGALFFGGYDLLMVFLCTSTASIFLILAASSTHTAYTGVGTLRELVQMMCCEPMELLVAIGFYLSTSANKDFVTPTFKVIDLVRSDMPAIIYLPGFFIGFIFILTIKFRKSPFDISTSHHAHQEVVKGVTAEFSGAAYGIVEVAEWYEQVMLLGVVGLFFITSNPLSYIVAALAIILVYFLEIIIDNTSARVKWDLMFKLSWGIIFICGGTNLLVLEIIRNINI
ncbi:MAG: NADH-quinone oxidoreductase subunit H [Lachnospiraceae bacterium]|nr:NADH-quinone oxidoreductase subunit H [Lachnospiraceae bacterium]